MNDDKISKHTEFKDSLKAYKEYLNKLNIEAKKKLDNLNNKSLVEKIISLGFLDTKNLNDKIKEREKKLATIAGILELDRPAHRSVDTIAYENESVIAALNALPVLDEMAEKKISASFVNEESKKFAEEKNLSKRIEKEKENWWLVLLLIPDLLKLAIMNIKDWQSYLKNP